MTKSRGIGTVGGNEEWQSLGKRPARITNSRVGTWERKNIPDRHPLGPPMSAQDAQSPLGKVKTNRAQKIEIVLGVLRKATAPMLPIDIAKTSRIIGAQSWIYVVCRDMWRAGIIKRHGDKKYELR